MKITTAIENKSISFNNLNLSSQGKLQIEDHDKVTGVNPSLITNRYLSLIIMPTENCNFRCTYCYEDFSIGRMKSTIIDGVKSLIKNRCSELDHINIDWFGGEPLMAKDVVLDISKFVMSMTYLNPRLRYSGGMTTNAYLLDHKTVSNLSNAGVRQFQISLDGSREFHDKSRLRADGGSTFDRIWSNLLAIRNSSLPLKIVLRIHVTVENSTHLNPLLEDIKREFLSDSRFSVFFKAIERLGGVNDHNIKQLSEKEHTTILYSLKEELFGESNNYSQSEEPPNNYICYASRPNSLVIRANGDIGKCTVALYDERNKIARLKPDGMIEVIPGRLGPWVRGLETLDSSTLACPLNNLPIENHE
jgi:uncharacterized protein